MSLAGPVRSKWCQTPYTSVLSTPLRVQVNVRPRAACPNSSNGVSSKVHPYLHGNLAPIQKVHPLTACQHTGIIPEELAGGQYVRNGGNPVTTETEHRDAHWFDGDGMLTGVAFRRTVDGGIQAEFVNQYILTDAYIAAVTTPSLKFPILPSIATLLSPSPSLPTIISQMFRLISLITLSHLSGSQHPIRRASVANTGILFHDGRALATCETGPPIRISLPGLETVGWFDGRKADGEPATEGEISGKSFGGDSPVSFVTEWTTAHPRVDPVTKELILFHSTMIAPFVRYSVIPSTYTTPFSQQSPEGRLVNAAVPGVASAKMMHDFGVSLLNTVIMDLPLSLAPLNLARREPVAAYDPSARSRFGVFPRWKPEAIRWFETSSCYIFHTANTWDDLSPTTSLPTAVSMLTCHLTSASVVFSAGNIAMPVLQRNPGETEGGEEEEERCRLYYFQFDLTSPAPTNVIRHQWALSAIPLEFPSIRADVAMTNARYVYCGCVSETTFAEALGGAIKIDALVKVDAHVLIARGKSNPPKSVTGCVDMRTAAEILSSTDPHDPIQIFKLPPGWYAQESTFVPRSKSASEDDGWILSYVFDEKQLDALGNAPSSAKSELWAIDARDMKTVVAKIKLPQRVPYGFHRSWFSQEQIMNQRPIGIIRQLPAQEWNLWMNQSRCKPRGPACGSRLGWVSEGGYSI